MSLRDPLPPETADIVREALAANNVDEQTTDAVVLDFQRRLKLHRHAAGLSERLGPIDPADIDVSDAQPASEIVAEARTLGLV